MDTRQRAIIVGMIANDRRILLDCARDAMMSYKVVDVVRDDHYRGPERNHKKGRKKRWENRK